MAWHHEMPCIKKKKGWDVSKRAKYTISCFVRDIITGISPALQHAFMNEVYV